MAKVKKSVNADPDPVIKITPVKTSAAAAVTTTSVVSFTQTLQKTLEAYKSSLTPKFALIDIFLGFLVALGALQFVFCCLVGNFPFNAFLGGFISTVGQFVLTVSLRLQFDDENRVAIWKGQGKEMKWRAMGDYIFASLVLHFIVYHFIN
ncbi:hypothetical protein BABINDRAFT_160299 [Babjeviella inositovora NRRL Y-12698]|uniref:Dolichyl-diphosphooligosaccharide--protein glycosyltransferase subunit OST2 n=1 Tax=Babjeviella inositovora NRRL Y-12698 TaxID=984486 RepID=A0A1E3QWQ1_9ASCO|nr:uncharacterized protein BABINDRAFT_160299 [Babjeviella inositovora NRRL Y-12698]ODQ82105.1 hypothetical protein BABINDRAFT_160299 [Babjeviella inositovora NRRL Y-12698]